MPGRCKLAKGESYQSVYYPLSKERRVLSFSQFRNHTGKRTVKWTGNAPSRSISRPGESRENSYLAQRTGVYNSSSERRRPLQSKNSPYSKEEASQVSARLQKQGFVSYQITTDATPTVTLPLLWDLSSAWDCCLTLILLFRLEIALAQDKVLEKEKPAKLPKEKEQFLL